MDIKNSVALITGGGKGIGEAVAKHFVRQGAKVAIVDMVQEDIDRVVAEIKAMGGEAIGVQADVSSEADTARFIEATVSAFGQLNIAVTCAGIIRDVLVNEGDAVSKGQVLARQEDEEPRLAAARAEPGVTSVRLDTGRRTTGFYERFGFVAIGTKAFVLPSGQVDGHDVRMIRRQG